MRWGGEVVFVDVLGGVRGDVEVWFGDVLVAGGESDADGSGLGWWEIGGEIGECGDVEVVRPSADGGGVRDVSGEEFDESVCEGVVAGDFGEMFGVFECKGCVALGDGVLGHGVVANAQAVFGWVGEMAFELAVGPVERFGEG